MSQVCLQPVALYFKLLAGLPPDKAPKYLKIKKKIKVGDTKMYLVYTNDSIGPRFDPYIQLHVEKLTGKTL